MSSRPRVRTNLIMLIVFAVLSIGGMEFLAINMGQPIPLASSYTLHAVFPDADGVPTNADVAVAGVLVGHVISVDKDPRSPGFSVVTMHIDDYRAVPVYTNGSVTVRPKTLLGEKYVDLVVGSRSAEAIDPGGYLPIGQATKDVSNDEIFNSFDAQTRAQEQQVLADLNAATTGKQADIRALLPELQRVVTDLQPVAEVYRQDQPQVDHILVQLDTILKTTADENAQISGLLHNGSVALGAIANRDKALISTLQEAANVADEINAAAAPTIGAQRQAINEMSPAFTSLNRLLDQITGPQAACGGKPCGIDEAITETFLGSVNYPNDQLGITSTNGETVTDEWASMFSMPAGNGQHKALNIVLSEHCDSVAQTLSEIIASLPAAEQQAIQAACEQATGHAGSSGSATPVPQIPGLPSLPQIIPNFLLTYAGTTEGNGA